MPAFHSAIRGFRPFEPNLYQTESSDDAGNANHEYIRGDIDDMSPCPALNALANHGYLPRDGRNISVAQIYQAFTQKLHMSPLLARFLAIPAKSFLKPDGTFSLVDLRAHNVIEHDYSFTRLAHSEGDNFSFQPSMLRTMIEVDARGGPVTVRTLARTYNRRRRENRERGVEKLTWRLWFVGLSQTVSFMTVTGLGGTLEKEVMWEFYGEEKWPDVVLRNEGQRWLIRGLWRIVVLLFWIVFGG